MFPGQNWIYCCERDSSAALSFEGPSTSSWFALLLELRVQMAPPSQARALLSPSALQRGVSLKVVLQELPSAPEQGTELQGCKPARGARGAELSFACPAEEEGGFYVVCVSSVLELSRQFRVGFVTCLQRGEL